LVLEIKVPLEIAIFRDTMKSLFDAKLHQTVRHEIYISTFNVF